MRRGRGEGGGHLDSCCCPRPCHPRPLLVVPGPLVLVPLVRQDGGGGVAITIVPLVLPVPLLVAPIAPTVVPICLVVVMSMQGRGGVVAIVPIHLVVLVMSAPLITLVPSVVTAGVTTIVVVVECG